MLIPYPGLAWEPDGSHPILRLQSPAQAWAWQGTGVKVHSMIPAGQEGCLSTPHAGAVVSGGGNYGFFPLFPTLYVMVLECFQKSSKENILDSADTSYMSFREGTHKNGLAEAQTTAKPGFFHLPPSSTRLRDTS